MQTGALIVLEGADAAAEGIAIGGSQEHGQVRHPGGILQQTQILESPETGADLITQNFTP